MTNTQREAMQTAIDAFHTTNIERHVAAIGALRAALAEPVAAPSHFDDAAVDRFSDALKVKMKIAREKGRHGWHDQRLCSEQALQQMLTDHMAKGDPVDVGNFAMMLWNRGEKVAPPPPAEPVALVKWQVGGLVVHIVGDVKEGAALYTSPQPPAEPAVEPPSPTPTAGMNIAQRILHVGGRNNAAGYVEFGSIQAVDALVRQVLRDLPASTAEVPLLSDDEIYEMYSEPRSDAEMLAFGREVEQIVRNKAGII